MYIARTRPYLSGHTLNLKYSVWWYQCPPGHLPMSLNQTHFMSLHACVTLLHIVFTWPNTDRHLHPRPPCPGFPVQPPWLSTEDMSSSNRTPQRTNFTLILKYITIGHICQVLYINLFWDSLSFDHIEKMESWFEINFGNPWAVLNH